MVAEVFPANSQYFVYFGPNFLLQLVYAGFGVITWKVKFMFSLKGCFV